MFNHSPQEADSVVVVTGATTRVHFVLALRQFPDEGVPMIDLTPVRDARLTSGSPWRVSVKNWTPWRVGAPAAGMTFSREEQVLQWIQSRPRARR
jgi:hypothetical protein